MASGSLLLWKSAVCQTEAVEKSNYLQDTGSGRDHFASSGTEAALRKRIECLGGHWSNERERRSRCV